MLLGILFQLIVFIFVLGVGVSCCGNLLATVSGGSGAVAVGTGGFSKGGGGGPPPMVDLGAEFGSGGGASGGGGGGGGGPGTGGGGGGGGGPGEEVFRLCFRLPHNGCLAVKLGDLRSLVASSRPSNNVAR